MVSGLVALLIIGLIVFVALRRESTRESIRDAKDLTQYIAASVVQPALRDRPDVLTGEPSALAWFDERMRARVLNRQTDIVRVKVWTTKGRIVYSDQPELTGKTYDLSEDISEAIEQDGPVAEVSTLTAPENEFDNLTGKLLEVYVPIRAPNDQTLVFETYRSYSTIDAAGSTVFGKFLPILLLGLLVLSLLYAPLGWSMARQLRASQRERERLLVSAIDASERERRRIASEVHDGPVQELAGLSFALAGAADGAGVDTPLHVRTSLDEAARTTRGIMRRLRGLLVDIHPPTLHAAGLQSALSDALAQATAKGIEATLDVEEMPAISPDDEALLFRGAQEALRNAIQHGGAKNVRVSVTSPNGSVRIEVYDDGRGFDAAERARRREEGHLGLEILGDLVRHAGGRLDIQSAPGHGTRVAIVLPRR